VRSPLPTGEDARRSIVPHDTTAVIVSP